MQADPNRAPRQPEVAPETIQAFWAEANAAAVVSPLYPILNRSCSFSAQLDGLPVEMTVIVHPDFPDEENVIGAMAVRPEQGSMDHDATHYQFQSTDNGDHVTLRKLLPVDISRSGFTEPMPEDPADYDAWLQRHQAHLFAYEIKQRAEHMALGLDTIYENEAQELLAILQQQRARQESQEEPILPKGFWLGALLRRWFYPR